MHSNVSIILQFIKTKVHYALKCVNNSLDSAPCGYHSLKMLVLDSELPMDLRFFQEL